MLRSRQSNLRPMAAAVARCLECAQEWEAMGHNGCLPEPLLRVLAEHRWELVERVPAVSTTAVVRVRDGAGTSLIVKYSEEVDALDAEFTALQAFGPTIAPAAELLEPGVLVLEDVGDRTLAEVAAAGESESDRLIENIVDLLNAMKVEPPPQAPPLSVEVDKRTDLLRDRLNGIARVLVDRSATVLNETEPAQITLVHADLHPKNLIVDPRDRRLRIIDPYGMAGDPTHDAAMLSVYMPNAGELYALLVDPTNVRSAAWFDWMLANRYDNARRHLGPPDPITRHLERQINERGDGLQ